MEEPTVLTSLEETLRCHHLQVHMSVAELSVALNIRLGRNRQIALKTATLVPELSTQTNQLRNLNQEKRISAVSGGPTSSEKKPKEKLDQDSTILHKRCLAPNTQLARKRTLSQAMEIQEQDLIMLILMPLSLSLDKRRLAERIDRILSRKTRKDKLGRGSTTHPEGIKARNTPWGRKEMVDQESRTQVLALIQLILLQ